MEKILKKYTMIPDELYVNRGADKQLEAIVDEMQRPGYVLVARQMGKTNLLFNAKRKLEHDSRLFVYADLSNTFKLERDCYRSIIDNIIEPNEVLFESIELKINELRDKKLPPHNEYSRSLRIILNKFDGIIVIVLDEIDALRSADYSDNIFAQIRSNYFSRTNFPEFERLTYILSGVIEPNELIKDRNKSPFNIGEKIYLDDFTNDEHQSFISKSKLSVSDKVSDYIYEWTNGNPRLTFDICSEIEGLTLQDKEVTLDSVNDLVNKKYLTTFDISPIDHIRELVKSNKNARSAVLKIQQERTLDLSDEIKKKLYLYGIIDSNFDKETVIKNRIIKLSLTEDWIRSIDKQSESSFTYALSLFDNEEYSKSIEALLEFLSNSNPSKTETELSNYYLGYAYYNLKEYLNSSEYFSKDIKGEPYKRNSRTLLGVCKLGLGETAKGLAILEEVILIKSNDFAYHNAILNLARHVDDIDKAFSLYQDLYDSTQVSENEEDIKLNLFKTLALYHQGEIFFQKNDNKEALKKFTSALEFSTTSNSLYLKYLIYHTQENKDENLKTDITKTIIEHDLNFDDLSTHTINYCEDHLISYLGFIFDENNTKLFEELLNHVERKNRKDSFDKYQLAYRSSKFTDKTVEILKYIEQFEKSLESDLLLLVYKDLSIATTSNDAEFLILFDKYQHLFCLNNKVEQDDIYLFSIAIKLNADLKMYSIGLELCEIINKKIIGIDDENLTFESLVIYYWYAYLNHFQYKKEDASLYAKQTIQLIEDSERKRTSAIDEEGLKSIKKQMKTILNSSQVNIPFRKGKKYGQNDWIKVKYSDGTVVEDKYKRLKDDIHKKRCEIIS